MIKLFTTFVIIASVAIPSYAAEKPALGSSDNSKQPIQVDADSLEVFQDQEKAVFSGHVVAKQGNMTVKAERMVIYYMGKKDLPAGQKKSADTKNSIRKIDLEGNVLLTAPNQTAKSKSGFYDMQKNFISITGDVILTKDNNILKGNKLDYSIDSGYSKLYSEPNQTGEGRVRALFVPAESGGK